MIWMPENVARAVFSLSPANRERLLLELLGDASRSYPAGVDVSDYVLARRRNGPSGVDSQAMRKVAEEADEAAADLECRGDGGSVRHACQFTRARLLYALSFSTAPDDDRSLSDALYELIHVHLDRASSGEEFLAELHRRAVDLGGRG